MTDNHNNKNNNINIIIIIIIIIINYGDNDDDIIFIQPPFCQNVYLKKSYKNCESASMKQSKL